MKLHTVLLVLGIIGLAVVIILNLHQLSSFVKLLGDIKWYVLLLIIAVQITSYYINGLYYKTILKLFGYEIKISRLVEGALASNFVNYIVPTAGVAGAGFLSQVLKPDVPRGKGFLTQIMRYTFSALAALLMIPLGILAIVSTRHGNSTIDHVAIVSAISIIVFGVIIVALVEQHTILMKIVNWIAKKLKRFKKFNQKHFYKFVDDFYEGYRSIRNNKRGLLIPYVWSIVYILVEILTLYLVFVAFGKFINPGIVTMGYIMANLASIFGGTFFSTGVFELGMIGTFLALGLPFVLALSVSVVYRIINLAVGMPPGFYYYHKYLNSKKIR